MAMAVHYTNFDGRLLHENRGGTIAPYVPDTLGSVAAVLPSSSLSPFQATYWPYGEVNTSSGINPSPWAFVGTLGYYVDVPNASTYVRARFYKPATAQWLTRDPIWPSEKAYVYCAAAPSKRTDPRGLQVNASSPPLQRAELALQDSCWTIGELYQGNSTFADIFNECAKDAGCQPLNRGLVLCMFQMCAGAFHIVLASNCDPACRGACGSALVNQGVIVLCRDNLGKSGWNSFGIGAPYHITLIHELLHLCGVTHDPNAPGDETCNSVMACCLLKAGGFVPPWTACFKGL